MSNNPRRGKRGPAPSWKLGSTRAIRVPIVLADALLHLARQIDNGEVSLANAVLTADDVERGKLKQEPEPFTQRKDKQILEEKHGEQKHYLAEKRAAAKVMFAENQARFAESQAKFIRLVSEQSGKH